MFSGTRILSAQDAYFQQEVNFRINATLNDRRNLILASEEIEYINNSPDTLGFLYFHLWPNAYSSNTTDLARQLFTIGGKQRLFNNPRSRGRIDSLEFKIGNVKADWHLLPDQPDICIINLPSSALPGDTIYISTPFRVRIPDGDVSRMGYDNGIYQISQWYPKPAVYDIDGWHPMPYLDQGEFYSEFGKYDVTINIQEDYVVGASGDLESQNEIEWLNEKASQWRDTRFEQNRSDSLKTIHFTAKDIHDFAWVTGKGFKAVRGSIVLPESGRKVTTMVLFTAWQALLWDHSPEYVNRSLLRFSEWIGDYPYNTFTAVQASLGAGLGMEYPGMAVIGGATDQYSLDEVIAHEVCHSWFYAALGTDERRFPFLDEGLTSAYEDRYMDLYYPGKKMWELYFRSHGMAKLMKIDQLPAGRISEIQWLINARNNLEQPLNLPAQEYTDRNYSDLIYFKTAQGFTYLRAFLGDSLFDAAMKDFYRIWAGRHPSPGNLREVFSSHTGRDLSWFFDDFIGDVKRYDYRISKLSKGKMLVQNKGELNSPLAVSGFNGDALTFTFWHEGFTGKKWIDLDDKTFDNLRLNAAHIVPELNYTNNNIRSSGIFRKRDPMAPQVLVSIEDPERRTLMLVPLVNWNRADGVMAGFALNNSFMLPKKAEYLLMPFYTFRDPGIKGKGRIALNFTPFESVIRKMTISLEGSKFGATEFSDYILFRPSVDIFFRNKDMVSSAGQKVFTRLIYVSDLTEINNETKAGSRGFWQAGYSFFRSGLVNPFDLTTLFETGGSYDKVSVELNYRLSYYGKNKGLDIRFFMGTMLRSDPEREIYSFAPSGRSGKELYLFEGDLPDRFSVFPSDFWSRQMVMSEGAIVTPVNDSTGYSRSLLSLSLESNFPGFAGKLPVKPFAGFVYAPAVQKPYFLEAGFKAGLWNFFEINVPLLVSENISSIRPSVKERIRFTLNLEALLRIKL